VSTSEGHENSVSEFSQNLLPLNPYLKPKVLWGGVRWPEWGGAPFSSLVLTGFVLPFCGKAHEKDSRQVCLPPPNRPWRDESLNIQRIKNPKKKPTGGLVKPRRCGRGGGLFVFLQEGRYIVGDFHRKTRNVGTV